MTNDIITRAIENITAELAALDLMDAMDAAAMATATDEERAAMLAAAPFTAAHRASLRADLALHTAN